MDNLEGYMHAGYPHSLREFGRPFKLPLSGGWLIHRSIVGTPHSDAMGCYPIFTCEDWSQLHVDLEYVKEDMVCVSIVTDPFGGYEEPYLRQCFPEVVTPFKQHFVVDLDQSPDTIVCTHHRYYAHKVIKKVSVEVCKDPAQFTDEWLSLYANLIDRHQLQGIKAFSKTAFAEQLSIPGTVMFRVTHQAIPVAAQIWFVQKDIGYSHLTAVSETGYALRASYALYWYALSYFCGKVRWLDLGAGAGAASDGNDGLSQFKRGWATGTRPVYFCGRIFQPGKYAEIVKAKGVAGTNYFPAYRRGEFR